MTVAGSILPPLVQAAPVAIACIDRQGSIADANRALLDGSGYTLEELKGRPFTSFLEPADGEPERQAFAWLAMGDGDSYAGSHRYRTRAGEVRNVDLRIAVVRDADGAPQCCLAVLQDVTEHRLALDQAAEAQRQRQQLLLDLRRAHLESEAANRVKDGFLSTLAHELRTPINAVILWAHVLRSRHEDSETVHALDAIEGSAVAQARLVNDLLDASRIITGRIQLRLELVDLSSIIRSAVESIAEEAAAKEIAVSTELPAGLPAVRGDAQRLEQVFWNLLTNAVKFTDPGGTVTVQVRRGDRTLAAEVRDTGYGIAPEILPLVFDRFLEEGSAASPPHLGFGFGLAVVRRLVELHGGTVAAESAGPGQGATFRVELPITT